MSYFEYQQPSCCVALIADGRQCSRPGGDGSVAVPLCWQHREDLWQQFKDERLQGLCRVRLGGLACPSPVVDDPSYLGAFCAAHLEHFRRVELHRAARRARGSSARAFRRPRTVRASKSWEDAKEQHGFVYIIQCGPERVKIGWSTNPANRFLTLPNTHGMTSVLGLRRGGPKVEKQLHDRYWEFRVARSEHFAADERILRYAAKLPYSFNEATREVVAVVEQRMAS